MQNSNQLIKFDLNVYMIMLSEKLFLLMNLFPRDSHSCSLFNTDLFLYQSGIQQSYKIERKKQLFIQLIKKNEFRPQGRVYIESRLLPKRYGNRKLNSKNTKLKKSFLQKLIYLANAFQNAFQILLLDEFWRMLLSEIFRRKTFWNLPRIRKSFSNQI